MKHPSSWSKEDLHQHLQHALSLELWTIPLYLTALYSIKGIRRKRPDEYPEAAKLVFSVAIQEMLHMELVCNISNALGFTPRFHPPVYDEDKGIPFIHPVKNVLPAELHGYSVKPQALNQDSLKLFCAIELPHPRTDILWDHEKSYNSIADLYEALKIGITHLWDQYYVGHEKNIRQKNSFNEYHNSDGKNHGFSQEVNSLESALKAIDAIVEQGEGADHKVVPSDFRPPKIEPGKEYDLSWFKGHLSHYQKFRILLHSYHKLPEVYSANPEPVLTEAQEKLTLLFHEFLTELQRSFSGDSDTLTHDFYRKMYGLCDAITAVWETGNEPIF